MRVEGLSFAPNMLRSRIVYNCFWSRAKPDMAMERADTFPDVRDDLVTVKPRTSVLSHKYKTLSLSTDVPQTVCGYCFVP